MISLTNIHLRLGGRPVLKGVNLHIQEGECISVVGPNGCGKSTLLRVLAGIEKPEDGELNLPGRCTVGYLPQEANLEVSHSLEEALLETFAEVLNAFSRMRHLEHAMGSVDPDSAEYARLLQEYEDWTHLVEQREGYSLKARVRQVAGGLGFQEKDFPRSCREFSGGWQMRILLAKLLLQNPDILLLDEPTNHLDLESILWLEDWLRKSERTIIMVSHERAFMDRLADRIVCLEWGRAETYPGDYSNYIIQSEDRREAHRKAYEEQQKEIAQMETFIRKFRYNASRASLVQSRIKQLEKIERIEPPFHPGAIHFDFPPAPRSYQDVMILENVGHRYGQKQVFSQVNLKLLRGEKIGLVGINGAGKSTLLRILAGREQPTGGRRMLGEKVSLSYFAQYDSDLLTSNQTLLQAIEAAAPTGQQTKARDLLGAFLFTGDAVEKPLRALSGGEKTRFRLAQLLFSPANLLLLDEPTNHLDVTSRATVEEALRAYQGTVVIVSHDRVFMERVTTRIVEIENGLMRTYPGSYGEYLTHKQKVITGETPAETSQEDSPSPLPDKEQRLKEREEQKARSRKIRSIERRIEAVEADIEQKETRITELTELMATPQVSTDFTRLNELVQENQVLQDSYQENLDEWEKLHRELESLGQ